MATCLACTNIRNAQSCCERLTLADVNRYKAIKSECTIYTHWTCWRKFSRPITVVCTSTYVMVHDFIGIAVYQLTSADANVFHTTSTTLRVASICARNAGSHAKDYSCFPSFTNAYWKRPCSRGVRERTYAYDAHNPGQACARPIAVPCTHRLYAVIVKSHDFAADVREFSDAFKKLLQQL